MCEPTLVREPTNSVSNLTPSIARNTVRLKSQPTSLIDRSKLLVTVSKAILLSGLTASIYAQSDYDVWRAQFGQMAGSAASQLTAVPEPTTLLMLIVGLLAMLSNRAAMPEIRCSTLLRRQSVELGPY